jgi:hypothetical protein
MVIDAQTNETISLTDSSLLGIYDSSSFIVDSPCTTTFLTSDLTLLPSLSIPLHVATRRAHYTIARNEYPSKALMNPEDILPPSSASTVPLSEEQLHVRRTNRKHNPTSRFLEWKEHED